MAKVALLIGVSEYEPGLTPLPSAIRDVDAMRRVLQDPKLGEFAEADVTVLENPNRPEMEEAIYALFNERHRDNLLLLYFSGHSILDHKKNKLYLSTHKTRMTDKGSLMPLTAVPASFIHDCMSLSRSRRVIILDSCFSGAFAEGLISKDVGTVDVGAQLGSKDWAVLTSSTSLQYSFEQQGADLSIYTRYLVDGIRTGAADQDGDGFIAIGELHEYASRKVCESQAGMKPEIYTLREGFKIRLSKAPPLAPRIRYRNELIRFINQDEVSHVTPRMLKFLRSRVANLSSEAAISVEDEILLPHWPPLRERKQRYEQVFMELLQQGYPLSDSTRNERQQIRELLYLRDEDIEELESEKIQQWQSTQLIPKAEPSEMPAVQAENPSPQETSQDTATEIPSVKTSSPIPSLVVPVIAPLSSLPPTTPQTFSQPPPSPFLSLQHRSWLLLGTAIGVFGGSTIATNSWMQFQTEQKDRQKPAPLQTPNATASAASPTPTASPATGGTNKNQQTKEIEASIISIFSPQLPNPISAANCPNLEKLEAGKAFDCQLTIAEGTFPATVTLKDDKGDFGVNTKNILVMPVLEKQLVASIKQKNQIDVKVDCGSPRVKIFKNVGETIECKLTQADGKSGTATATVTTPAGETDAKWKIEQ